ncbi:MAG: DUF4147 domain-containing protein [Patescibacteria group bacterium]
MYIASNNIHNATHLASTTLRKDVLSIIDSGLDAIDTKGAIRRSVQVSDTQYHIAGNRIDRDAVDRLLVIGIGKCAMQAAHTLEEVLGDDIDAGIVLDVHITEHCDLKKMLCYAGTHPLPSDYNIQVTKKIVSLLSGLTERDVVIFVISGGGSTLLCMPEAGATCVEEKVIVGALMSAGASIQEINTIRKHMSLARGGYLAQYAHPARVFSLIFSDVPGDDLEFIASGPTVKDTTTIADADVILEKYRILRTCNIAHCGLIETPKEDTYFARVVNALVVSNVIALNAMSTRATELGYAPEIISKTVSGSARIVAAKVIERLHSAPKGVVQLYGGETTVVVHGTGHGGRNQELSLATLSDIHEDELVCSLASDGRDNGLHAGGIADKRTLAHADTAGINVSEFLDTNNSAVFFSRSGDAILTGDTGSNVSDLIIAMKEKSL